MKPQRRFAPTGWPPWIGTAGRFQSEQLAGISGIGSFELLLDYPFH